MIEIGLDDAAAGGGFLDLCNEAGTPCALLCLPQGAHKIARWLSIFRFSYKAGKRHPVAHVLDLLCLEPT